MKKYTCILVLISLLLTSISIANGSSKEVTMELYFVFREPRIEKIQDIVRVTVAGLPNSNEYNKPRMPVKPVRVLLPQMTKVKDVRVIPSTPEIIGSYKNIEVGSRIMPLQQQAIAKKKISISHDSTAYPENLFSIEGVYNFRGYSILYVNLYPVYYTPSTGEIKFYRSMTLIVSLEKGDISNNLFRGLERDDKIVRSFVDNPEIASTYNAKNSAEVGYLIITSENFTKYSGEYNLQRFIEYKENKGLDVRIATVENITRDPIFWNKTDIFNDTQAQIRNFIRYAYLNWNTDYVLLVGDADVNNPEENIVPARYLFATTGGMPLTYDGEEGFIPSDLYYACLDGNFNEDTDDRWGENATENNVTHTDEADLLAEVWVGRACVDSYEELSNFVMKTITYDQTNDDPYLSEILMVGEYLGFQDVADFGGNYKDEVKELIPDEYEILTLYDRDWPTFDPNDPWSSGWSKSDLIELLNRGMHIVNHDGHGWTNYGLRLHNYDIETLSNTKYCFIYSQTCLAGSFDNWYPHDHYYTDDCAAEHFTVETPHGAFAVIMNSRYGLGMEGSTDAPSQRYDLSFFNAIFNKNIREIGRANHASKEDNLWRIDEPGMRWACYETNLLGDPELSIKHAKETKINISIDILRPQNGKIYLFNKEINIPLLRLPLIFSNITIEANITSQPQGFITKVEFYIDGKLHYVDYKEPYEYNWDERVIGRHMVNITAYATNNRESKEIEVRIFNI